MARQRPVYRQTGQRPKPPERPTRRPLGDTLAACVTRVMWTPVRRLAGRSGLRAALGYPGRGAETAARPAKPRLRRSSSATVAIPAIRNPAARPVTVVTAAMATVATATPGT